MRSLVAATACSLVLVLPATRGIAQGPRTGSERPRAGQGVAGGWGDERVLSTGPGPVDLAYNFARAIAADSAGRLHVVWYERRDGKECAFYRRSTDEGRTWEDAVCLSEASEPMPQDPLLPVVAASGDDVYVAWHEKGQDGMNIRFRRSGDGGKNWQPVVSPAQRRGASAHAAIAATGRVVHVVFGDHRDGDQTEIYYTRSTDAGATWEPERRLTELPHDSWVPSLAAGDDDVVFAWVDTRDGNEEEYVRVSRDRGRSWGPQTRLTENAAKSWAPSVCVAGGVIHLAWFDQKDARFRLIDAEAKLDEVLKSLDLTFEPPAPDPEEAAKRRATAKMKQVEAAREAWVRGGGDAAKLQAIMRELQEMAKPTGLAEADARLDEALRLIGVDPGNERPPADVQGWQRRFQGKMRRIQQEGPKWVEAGGDADKLRSIVQEFERRIRNAGSAPYTAKERKIDEAMRLLGLTYRPAPDREPSRDDEKVIGPRMQEKLKRIQAALPIFVQNGGNPATIQGLLEEFQSRVRIATTDWEIYYRRSRDGGRTWDPEVRLTDAAGLAHRPSLVADGNNLYVSWWDDRDGDNEIYLKRSRNGGRTWGPDRRLTRSDGDSTKPSLALTRDFLHLIWLDTRDGGPKLYYTRAARHPSE